MVEEEALDNDTFRNQVQGRDSDRLAAHQRIDEERPGFAENAGYGCGCFACDAVNAERHPGAADPCPNLVECPRLINGHEVTADDLELGNELRPRTMLMVLRPRVLAIAMTDRPTPELAAFCATQSPGLRSMDSSSSRAAVGGLMPSIASWRGSASGRENRLAAGARGRSRRVEMLSGTRPRAPALKDVLRPPPQPALP